MHERNCFLTLTIDDAHMPADQSINPRHWQLFAKRLRTWQGPFRYYHCGEYGERTERPHYHALIFGHDFEEDRVFHKQTRGGHNLYICEELDNLWKLGHVYIGELTLQSAAYTARYTMKKLTDDPDRTKKQYASRKYGERVCPQTGLIEYYRKPPYSTMSLKPGIGEPWFAEFGSDVFPGDQVVTANGQQSRVPRYYDYLLERDNPQLLEELKAQRHRSGKKHEANNTWQRLKTRDESARLKTLDQHRYDNDVQDLTIHDYIT